MGKNQFTSPIRQGQNRIHQEEPRYEANLGLTAAIAQQSVFSDPDAAVAGGDLQEWPSTVQLAPDTRAFN